MARRALVTGGNRGIGRAIAEGLLAEGLEVVVGARSHEDGRETAGALGCDAVQLDLEDKASIEAAVAKAGPIDILINNAGVLWDRPLLENPEDLAVSWRVMVEGPYELIRQLAPGMRDRGFGRIVNVSSGWGSFAEGFGGPGAYGVAKAALNALTVNAARELPDSVKINAMCPGWVRTRMGGASATRSPEEGADTAIWLATLPDDGPTGGFFRNRREIDW